MSVQQMEKYQRSNEVEKLIVLLELAIHFCLLY